MSDPYQVAAKLLILQKSIHDQGLLILNMLQVVGEADIAQTIKAYKEIVAGKYLIAHIVSTVELSSERKQELTRKVDLRYPGSKLVYVFDIDTEVEKGIEISIGDDQILFN